ncbi:MAG: dUTP diphosphatase [Hoeflea sp.]|jgi:dUTP pyrophosphatase|uniref:dUTP diphosphatase n=1 Tax=Hoeflea sp. TaxID=1940281 RepID=UPI0032EF4D0E
MQPVLEVKRLTPTASLPTRGSEQAAGLDLYADESRPILAGRSQIISTGISVMIPEGHYGRVAPRSGLAAKHEIDVLAGVIDSDYRGEIKVILHNLGYKTFPVQRGERIAQLILEKISIPEVVEVENLDITERGDGGFGSTG